MDSTIRAVRTRTQVDIMAAEKVVHVRQGANAMRVAPKDEIFLDIATDIDWLLTHRVRYFGGEALRQYYIKLLSERQLLSRSGQVYLDKLTQQLVDFFSIDVLQRLGCAIDFTLSELLHQKPKHTFDNRECSNVLSSQAENEEPSRFMVRAK
jgi:hypothetical protein